MDWWTGCVIVSKDMENGCGGSSVGKMDLPIDAARLS